MLPVAASKHKLISGPAPSLCAAIALLCVLSSPALARDSSAALEGTELLTFPVTSPSTDKTLLAPVAVQPQAPQLIEATVMGTPIENGKPLSSAAAQPAEVMPLASRQMDFAPAAAPAPAPVPTIEAAVVVPPSIPPLSTAPTDAQVKTKRNFAKPAASPAEREMSVAAPAAAAIQPAAASAHNPGMVERMFDRLFGSDEAEEEVALSPAEVTPVLAPPQPVASLPPQPDMFLSPEAISLAPPPGRETQTTVTVAVNQTTAPVMEELPPIYMSPPGIIVSATPPVRVAAVLQREAAPLPTQDLPEGKPTALVPEPEMAAVAPSAPHLPPAEESAARVMPLADMTTRAGSNFDPAKPRAVVNAGWRGERGQTLRQVLESWCAVKNVRLYWDTEYDYPLQASVMIDDSFENAVRALLDGFASATPQPVGRLHRQSQIGESVLIVQTRGNRYGN